jgi:arabinan endo-1,5-alpha-L-arabinosidase
MTAVAQTQQLTSQEAKTLYKSTSKRWTSIHDPSVVFDSKTKRYYIFGSHKAGAYTTDFQNWSSANPTWSPNDNAQAFTTPAVKKVKKGGVEVDFPQFNAEEWSHRTDADYNVNGNMWAPDVIWNPTMEKWCMYLSINGDAWHSSIILLTADNITGPYTYQGPVVICGFQDNGHSYKGTDLELVLGTQSALPSRYNVGKYWGNRWPHTIDPAVFYDEDGKLWLVYGSWSGGIWMLELDETTGLRDYDVVYPSTGGNTDGVTSDPYFGKKIAGGYYVSGEGPYIEHIGDYYYLFVSYGFFDPNGGYEMRVFRSDKPDGTYKDASNRSAVFTGYAMNYGTGADTRGAKLMGAYNNWGTMTVGECAQGHNSIIAADDGRTYLVYHTKFNNGTVGHQVRTHQVFLNKQGWLVAAPFEYNGEQVTDEDIKTRELVAAVDIPGTYQLLVHKYKMDYKNMEEVTPVEVTLTADGKVSGAYSGTWSREAGTSYLTIKLGSVTYYGIIYEEQMDGQTIKTVSFTAMANNGVNVWGYKMAPKYALAWQLNHQTEPVGTARSYDENLALATLWQGDPNVLMQWTSSHPDIISEQGRYNPVGLAENTQVDLTARLSSGDYYWERKYTVTAKSESTATPTADWQTGLVAHYGFDDDALSNSYDASQHAQLLRKSTTKLPTVDSGDALRNGGFVHLTAGANNKESYVSVPNPLKGKDLANGATLTFWVKRSNDNLWDALFGVTDGTARFYITGNAYIGFNNGQSGASESWIDLNHPSDVTPGYIAVGDWQLVTMAITKSAVTLYVNGTSKTHKKVNGKLSGEAFTTAGKFNYQLILDLLSTADELCLGNGSFWGSPDVCIDDLTIHSEALSSILRVQALKKVLNRVNTLSSTVTGISEVERSVTPEPGIIYDLQGRRVTSPTRGIYIINGRKTVVR